MEAPVSQQTTDGDVATLCSDARFVGGFGRSGTLLLSRVETNW